MLRHALRMSLLSVLLLTGSAGELIVGEPYPAPRARVEVIPVAPPPRVEIIPVAPGREYIWVPGRWNWRQERREHVWVPGYWHHRG
jgi:hypothetical protein